MKTRVILRSRNGCKNSGKFWWMMKFHYREALTPVLLMKFLQSRLQRDVRIWVSTVLKLTSLKTEIARSVRGPTLQGPRAEDAMEVPYLVQKILVILTTADHKVHSEGCASRNNHRYAVVVQDLATQWIQAYPCKNKKTSQERKELGKVLGARWEA